MAESIDAALRAQIDEAIAAGREMTFELSLASGDKRELRGTPTLVHKGRDGRERIGILVGMQTQQAVLLELITAVRP